MKDSRGTVARRTEHLQTFLTAAEVDRLVDDYLDGATGNDLDTATRQGLHARPMEDMVAWDSVVGHHLGLSHAHQSFVKGFYKTG